MEINLRQKPQGAYHSKNKYPREKKILKAGEENSKVNRPSNNLEPKFTDKHGLEGFKSQVLNSNL